MLCFQCGDYVYDSELAEVARNNQTQACVSLGISAVYTPWYPSPREMQVLQANPRLRTIVKDSTLGNFYIICLIIFNLIQELTEIFKINFTILVM